MPLHITITGYFKNWLILKTSIRTIDYSKLLCLYLGIKNFPKFLLSFQQGTKFSSSLHIVFIKFPILLLLLLLYALKSCVSWQRFEDLFGGFFY